jgi:hypothetical protein
MARSVITSRKLGVAQWVSDEILIRAPVLRVADVGKEDGSTSGPPEGFTSDIGIVRQINSAIAISVSADVWAQDRRSFRDGKESGAEERELSHC